MCPPVEPASPFASSAAGQRTRLPMRERMAGSNRNGQAGPGLPPLQTRETL